jgi:hypothetical protein
MTQLLTGTESVSVLAQATFGRDGAMFESLLDFVAQLSVVLWGLVIFTVVIRFVGVGIYRRGARRRAARSALAETMATSAAVPAAAVPAAAVPAAAVPTPAAVIDLVQPAAGQLASAVLVPAELVEVRTANSVANTTFNEVLQPAEAPAAVATSVKVARRATHKWHTDARSTAPVHALASNSSET